MSRPLLVGEINPYGADPRYALYPLPTHASGARLARILGLTPGGYMRAFDRANLCAGCWHLDAARREAARLLEVRRGGDFVLLGSRVARAFAVDYEPFTEVAAGIYVLPHPSGRCRRWNEPGAAERARALVWPLLHSGAAA